MKKFKSIQEELLFITKQNQGFCTPQQVVEFAENERTKLHSRFEWNDDKAGHEHRLWQARQIISLEFEIIRKDDIETGPVRLFISLRDDRNKNGGYRLTTDILSDGDLRKKLLHEALMELNHFRNKYKMLHELNELFSAIEKTETLVFEKSEV